MQSKREDQGMARNVFIKKSSSRTFTWIKINEVNNE